MADSEPRTLERLPDGSGEAAGRKSAGRKGTAPALQASRCSLQSFPGKIPLAVIPSTVSAEDQVTLRTHSQEEPPAGPWAAVQEKVWPSRESQGHGDIGGPDPG